MPLTNTQYKSIEQEYEQRRLQNYRLLKTRQEEVYAKAPEYRELEEKIASLSVAQSKKFLEGDETAITELKSKIRELKEQKHLAIIRAGLPGDYLDPIYDCPDCKDTGYIGTAKCHCLKQAITDFIYEQSNIKNQLQTENFATLSYEFYQGEDLLRYKNAVETCHNFVNNFNSDFHNILLYGTVGTGKSFLSGCIAKELIEKGHTVLYFSATSLFDSLAQTTFDYNAREERSRLMEDLQECDLLIIDDLGTEYTNSFTLSQLFSLINERFLRKKSLVISSNLGLEELRDRYSERIFSRLTGKETSVCKVTGPDIRLYKKRMYNRNSAKSDPRIS